MGSSDGSTTSGVKDALHAKLKDLRAGLVAKLEDLSEYDRRRPLTPTGTNLLGLVKHLAGVEYGYLGEAFGRPPPERLAWVDDGSIYEGADMWATPDESSDYILGLYRRACAHGDQTIAALDLDSPGSVAHWPPERRETTLAVLLVRMVAETAQHAGHADIGRELIDGRGGPDYDTISEDDWRRYLGQVEAAADTFRTARPTDADRFAAGTAARRRVLGEEYVRRAATATDRFNDDFQRLATEYGWGEVWGRAVLTDRQRSLNNLCLLAALNRPDEFKLHFRGALRNGCTVEELRDTLIQVAVYAGLPAGNQAFRLAREVLDAEGIDPGPAA